MQRDLHQVMLCLQVVTNSFAIDSTIICNDNLITIFLPTQIFTTLFKFTTFKHYLNLLQRREEKKEEQNRLR